VTITVTGITQDEPVDAGDGGNACPDATGIGTDDPRVRAERRGGGDGRVYHIAFVAENDSGGRCNGTVTVCVPKSQGQGSSCVDEGPLFDSAAGTCTGAECDDACTIELGASFACIGEKLPVLLNLRIERSRVLLARAADASTSSKASRLTGAAMKSLRRAARIAAHLQQKNKISFACAQTLDQVVVSAEARLSRFITP